MSVADRLPLGDAAGNGALLLGGLCVLLAAVFALTPLVVSLPGSLYVFFEVGILFALYGVLVLGLDLQYGHTGLVNFGHVAFFAVGAYAVAMLSARDSFAGISLGLPWPVALIGGIVAAALLGAAVGATSIRLRDDFLAVATLATAEIVHSLFVSFEGIFGGNVGIGSIPQPVSDLAGDADTAMLATILLFGGVMLLTLAAVTRLTEAPYGRVLRAIRADELVTRSVGKSVITYKMQSFVYGAALAGLAGGLFALYTGAVAPGYFTIQVTVTVWIGMLLGGAANHRGVLAGLAVIMGLRLLSRFALGVTPISADAFASVRLVVVGLVLVAVIRYRPAGIWGDAEELGVDT
ncbi:branched-chain amino acid ABC transporter permease [Halogeometricum sp. S1BR25-6]|uniref:Branched-chain amino acid ABC transporter permease n=1 Tax=Halogeometricum salsisoli TaxID=2950536 RepID=A0ABU2GJV3_9EURY|nr:branched-chain amino acid ABC transporter permease [Halogeometricum sp. S1BR25-6]MDS0300568.1 branched-chain amino acid ABC transporter permease [Halogeometricum sp. S1BR25-6]